MQGVQELLVLRGIVETSRKEDENHDGERERVLGAGKACLRDDTIYLFNIVL